MTRRTSCVKHRKLLKVGVCAGSAETGHRFLVAAHQTFALLATHPDLGWHSRLKHPALCFFAGLSSMDSRQCSCYTAHDRMLSCVAKCLSNGPELCTTRVSTFRSVPGTP